MNPTRRSCWLRFSLALPLAVLATSWSGCAHQTLESRVATKAELFAQLSPREQAMIKRGQIAIGFTSDMVLLALAKPDRIVAGPGPQQETWLYQTYYQADGSDLIPGQKLVTHWAEDTGGLGGTAGKNGPIARMPGTPPSAAAGWSGRTHDEAVTTTIEYDPHTTQVRDQAHSRVQVIFLRGVVADIRISQS
ncbi:hypothetical protein K0B96_01415 [Horticoccus luteus]|uniref:Uncharacterized protein n=1 Tax=Horticoccus luteus TaxID=2862869 RepID=A0A8F9TUI4_9BACT|nr:hypothetical protein [Horticoccus luteus]QYM79305.1 hypothetical protein K0B96_01415 [Horticoccus luteus]